MRSAIRTPPPAPWSAPWTWPNPTAALEPPCCIPRRACSNGTPGRTAHPALIADILSLLAGTQAAACRRPCRPQPPLEALSEQRDPVLRYLPTNLTGPEIAGELYVSLNTVRTHLRHLYAKLGTHRRAEAVARARALGLLAPSSYRGHDPRAG